MNPTVITACDSRILNLEFHPHHFLFAFLFVVYHFTFPKTGTGTKSAISKSNRIINLVGAPALQFKFVTIQ